jgi:hypothetical protein
VVEVIYFAIESSHHFPSSRKKNSWEILPNLVQKTKDVYVLQELFDVCQLLHVLICGYQKALMTFLPWSITF